MKNRLIIVAMDKEVQLVRQLGLSDPVLVGGIGFEMAEAIKCLPRDTPILNVGYAGSDGYPIGSVHFVTHSLMIDRSIHRPLMQSEGFQLEKKLCVTAYDFMTEPACKGPTLYDMELGLILGLDFTDVRSIKVVSDHLDLEEYTRNVETDGKMD